MNALDEPTPIDREELINAIYRTQTTLKLYADLMARERTPSIHLATLVTLDYINELMMRGQQFRLH